MENRCDNLYQLPYMLYARGCPAMIETGSLLEDKEDGSLVVLLGIRSLSDKVITECVVRVQPQETPNGRAWGEDELFLYDELQVKRDEQFGAAQPLELSSDAIGAEAFNVGIQSVIFEDGTEWDGETSVWGTLERPPRLEDALPPDQVEAWKNAYGEDCVCVPKTEQDLWWCTCGAWPNHERNCHACGRSVSITASNALKKAGVRKAPGKKRKGIIAACIACGIAAAVIVPTVGYASRYHRQNVTYQEAAEIYNAGEYEAAQDLFATISGFKDADAWAGDPGSIQAAKNILDDYDAEPAEDTADAAYEAARRAQALLQDADPMNSNVQSLMEKARSIQYTKAMLGLGDLTVRAGQSLSDMNARIAQSAQILQSLGEYRSAALTVQSLLDEQLLFEAAISSWRDGNFDPIVELAKSDTEFLKLDEELVSLAEEFMPFVGSWTHVQGNAELMASQQSGSPTHILLSTQTQENGEVYLAAYADTEQCLVSPFGADRSVFGFRSMSDPTVTMSISPDGSLVVNRTSIDGSQEDYALFVAEGAETYSPQEDPVPDVLADPAQVDPALGSPQPDQAPDVPADPYLVDPSLNTEQAPEGQQPAAPEGEPQSA